jgi:hypothetical protein
MRRAVDAVGLDTPGGVGTARSMAWNAPTNVRSSVLPRPRMSVWA